MFLVTNPCVNSTLHAPPLQGRERGGASWGGRCPDVLELQSDTPHHVKARHRYETNLRITVLIRMTVVVEDGTIHPSLAA